MEVDERYKILFEPLKIGPVVAPNRFYQVPHCNGMGYRDVTSMAALRAIKAEGGWGVVCTEQVEIHHTSEITPYIELRIWDDKDLPVLSRITNAVHTHGALAGIELAYNGMNGPNLYSREVPLGPSDLPTYTFSNEPVQARAMTKRDITNLRRWHRNAALRSKAAGFDIVYVYGAHGLGAPQHFLSRRYNQRTDEYGGSLKNRARLLVELIEDTKDAIGNTCAVACRIGVDELIGEEGIHREEMLELFSEISELPDLWDLTLCSWDIDSRTSRFGEEGHQEPLVTGFKQLTSKPVVGVGRFTSPDAMVSQIRRGVLDLIGAARPSIADPFLPKKIAEGRLEDIRECIGCNICVSGDMTMSPVRCTQNPTMGEEWRKRWHPEKIHTKGKSQSVLIVGGGPSGLECVRALGRRGYQVTLAEKNKELGGRVTQESRLPGLAAWSRVLDYRLGQIRQMDNVETYLGSDVTVEDILEFGSEHIVLATGSSWRNDGVGRHHLIPQKFPEDKTYTPDDIFAGRLPNGKVLVYDDDHYYLGGVIAELCRKNGCEVTLVTPAAVVSSWTVHTLEQEMIQSGLLKKGVKIFPHNVVHPGANSTPESELYSVHIYTKEVSILDCDALVLVTARRPNSELETGMEKARNSWADSGVKSVTRIGDALAPATIAAAVYSGHRYARELDEEIDPDVVPFERELTEIATEPNWKTFWQE
ncbi:MAG: FAD-dependent oxidoreductase [SAR324 cluster bacterium]|nr:FAD-dependent oxidoreductase [SAR324 cluster bacterium]